jgi:hypothetical protein
MKRKVMDRVLDEVANETCQQIKLYSKMELHRPFTAASQDRYFSLRREYYTGFAHSRQQQPVSPASSHTIRDHSGKSLAYFSNPVTNDMLLSHLNTAGYNVGSLEELSLLHEDKMEKELEAISHVMAYIAVASERYAAVISMILENVFGFAYAEKLQDCFTLDLQLMGSSGEENCKHYANDNPEIKNGRDRLKRDKKILSDCMKVLAKYSKFKPGVSLLL